jgi:hypothetical protein
MEKVDKGICQPFYFLVFRIKLTMKNKQIEMTHGRIYESAY